MANIMSARQKKFVEIYLTNGQNASAAYKEAYERPGLSPHELRRRGWRALQAPSVAFAVAKADKKAMIGVEEALGKYSITRERIAQELARIAFADVKDTMEWGEDGVKVKPSAELTPETSAAIAEVRASRGGLMVKNHDKQQALIALGKELGMFQEKHEHEHKHLAVNFVIEK